MIADRAADDASSWRALGDEIAVIAALPRDLDVQVFGLFDRLGQMRADALAGKKTPAAEPPAQETP